MGLARLMKMAFDGADLAPLGQSLISRAEKDPDDADALMDLSIILQLKYQPEIALDVQARALGIKTLYHLPAAGNAAIRLLAIMAPGNLMTNTPLEFMVEGSTISLDMLYVGTGLPLPSPLPDHELLFIAVGESTGTRPLLEELAEIMKEWPRPVLNQPGSILKTSREEAPACLAPIAEVIMPSSLRTARGTLATGPLPAFPFIIRPVDSHAGHGLAKIENAGEILSYLEAMPEPAFFVSPFFDYKSADGMYRKYRVLLIDGQPYACHMGTSENWMIHYLNAGMAESPEKREEEARFMADFDTGFGKRHRVALQGIHAALHLDYLVIDCAETRDGRLLVFEMDTGAVVHAMDPADVFPYKAPQMKKVFSAFYDMLTSTLDAHV